TFSSSVLLAFQQCTACRPAPRRGELAIGSLVGDGRRSADTPENARKPTPMPIATAVRPPAHATRPRRRAAGISRRLSQSSRAAVGMNSTAYEARLNAVSAFAVHGMPG